MTTTPYADAVLARVADLRAELQSLAAPQPEDDANGRDVRTPDVRLCDGILSYGRAKRLATADQTRALRAHHHHSFEQGGRSVTMTNGVPWWIPPVHLDPQQKPVHNTSHHRPMLIPTT